MATALIPEVIQPGVLYAPSAFNFFSIASAVMPNTDDGLDCDGATGNFRAYQPAIADIHYPVTPSQDHSLCFWSWQPSVGGGSSSTNTRPGDTIMAITDATLASTAQTSATSTAGFRLWIGPSTAPGTSAWVFHIAATATGRAAAIFLTGNSLAWKSTAIRHSASLFGSSNWVVHDFQLNLQATATISPVTPAAVTSPNFSIGPYSQIAGWDAYNAQVRLAKIAIFPTYCLTNADLLDLYDSMTSGPPSP